MDVPLILHIETATDICSVALSQGEQVLSIRESGPDRSHATLLSRYIREVFEDAEKEPGHLDAVAVSKGPGSYTGLRIGVSTAKGMAYGLGIPLLSCGTLEHMAHSAHRNPAVKGWMNEIPQEDGHPGLLLCPMIDARRMEVYSAVYRFNMEPVREVMAEVIGPGSFSELLEQHTVCFFGNGSEKCKEIITHPHARFPEGIRPSAGAMVNPVLRRYTENRFEDVAYFEPFYLKDFVATRPRKKIL